MCLAADGCCVALLGSSGASLHVFGDIVGWLVVLHVLLLVQETLHASEDYYGRGAWFDAVWAVHAVEATGQTRRRPTERSAAERRAIAAGAPRFCAEAEDVARILGLYFCTIPEGAPEHAGDKPAHSCTWSGRVSSSCCPTSPVCPAGSKQTSSGA